MLPRFSCDLQNLHVFLFQNFATNAAKVRNGHFCTILTKFCVFLILEELNENFFCQSLGQDFQKFN